MISFSGVTVPSSPTVAYSSGIAHYTQASANTFTYVLTVTNASGDMYTQNTFLSSDGQGNAFQNSGANLTQISRILLITVELILHKKLWSWNWCNLFDIKYPKKYTRNGYIKSLY